MWKYETFTDQTPQVICPVVKFTYLGENQTIKKIVIGVRLNQDPKSVLKIMAPTNFYLACICNEESIPICGKIFEDYNKSQKVTSIHEDSILQSCCSEMPVLEVINVDNVSGIVAINNLPKNWKEIIEFIIKKINIDPIDEKIMNEALEFINNFQI